MSSMNERRTCSASCSSTSGPTGSCGERTPTTTAARKPQIQAFRSFQIPESMQALYGYPALTAEVKRKIFGLNAAASTASTSQTMRRKITQDDIAMITLARRAEPAPSRAARARTAHARGASIWRSCAGAARRSLAPTIASEAAARPRRALA
jgi:hypothetical protein